MKEEMRTFGYLCPQCGKTVMGTRSVFALEASNAEVECACGKSALKVEFDGTEYHIYVPCGICGETHEAHCPPERVLRGATALGCATVPAMCGWYATKTACWKFCCKSAVTRKILSPAVTIFPVRDISRPGRALWIPPCGS